MEEITLEEIDIETGKLKSAVTSIWSGTGGGHLEAPHLYKINGWYYLMAAEGGTNFNHMVTIARSRSLWGEYESCKNNPILTNRHDTVKEIQCSGHGDLFQDHRGNWWMVHLGIRTARRTMSHLGRETFLTHILWEDGWPSMGDGKMEMLKRKDRSGRNKKETGMEGGFWKGCMGAAVDFCTRAQRQPFQRGDGKLSMHASRQKSDREIGSAFAAVRPLDFACIIGTEYQFCPQHTGMKREWQSIWNPAFIIASGRGKQSREEFIVLEKTAEDFQQTACCIPVEPGKLRLKIECSKEQYQFYYAFGKEAFQLACTASTRFLSCEVAGRCFTGTVAGLYALSKERTDAFAEYDSFIWK